MIGPNAGAEHGDTAPMGTTIRDWVGGDGDFSDSSQWSDPGANMGNPPASPPGASDTAVFDMAGSADIAGTVTNLVAQVNTGITLSATTAGSLFPPLPGISLAFQLTVDTILK